MIAAAAGSSVASESLPLPPTGRDFEVYRRVAVEGRTTREVAAEFNVSQTRVVQLRERVFEWMGTHLPPLARLSPADRLRIAETLPCEQLQHQYDEAMEAWRKSHTAVHVTRFVGRAVEDGVTVVKESQGDPKYLRLATQISKAIAKQGMLTMPNPETALPVSVVETGLGGDRPAEGEAIADCELRIEDSEEGGQAGEWLCSPQENGADHPERDCSTLAANRAVASDARMERVGESSIASASCELPAERKLSAYPLVEDAARTVQAVLQRLENVPRKTRKMLRREAQLREKLLRGDLMATKSE